MTSGPPVGYIQLSGFTQDAGPDVYYAYQKLTEQALSTRGEPLAGNHHHNHHHNHYDNPNCNPEPEPEPDPELDPDPDPDPDPEPDP